MGKSNIEWTDMVWNPVTGCTKVSDGCINCYAERMAMRFTGHFNVTCHPDRLQQPLYWKKPRRIFVCSMGDLFHEDVPTKFIERILNICAVSQHTFLILTKRPERMRDIFKMKEDRDGFYGHPSIWLGVTAENQEQADKRIPILLQIPAAKRFVSIEPMLGRIDLTPFLLKCPECGERPGVDPRWRIENFMLWGHHHGYPIGHIQTEIDPALDWVIIGAESGTGRRECKIGDVRSVVQQCRAADVPVFVKQLHFQKFSGKGLKLSKNPAEWPEDLRVQEYPG